MNSIRQGGSFQEFPIRGYHIRVMFIIGGIGLLFSFGVFDVGRFITKYNVIIDYNIMIMVISPDI